MRNIFSHVNPIYVSDQEYVNRLDPLHLKGNGMEVITMLALTFQQVVT